MSGENKGKYIFTARKEKVFVIQISLIGQGG